MAERKYGDDEIREIFELATTGSAGERVAPVESHGLTLAELQRVGEEAGIDGALVARAAAQLDARGAPSPVRKSFGLPAGFTRVIDLPRAPTDREWERLVADFRTSFGVQGAATSTGGLRQWSHGNLHLSLEPSAHGEQLRMSWQNDAVVALNALSAFIGGMTILIGGTVAAAGKLDKAIVLVGMMAGVSLASMIFNVMRAPQWAREKEQQMEGLAARAVLLLSSPSS